MTISDVVKRMQDRLDALPDELAHRRIFLGTYLRTTVAVGNGIEAARFEDPDWVEAWDVAFAELYLDAHDADLAGERPSRAVAARLRRARGAAAVAARAARDQRARELRPAAGAARGDQRRRLHRSGADGPPAPRPRADRRRARRTRPRRGRRADRCRRQAAAGQGADAPEPGLLAALPAREPAQGLAQHR